MSPSPATVLAAVNKHQAGVTTAALAIELNATGYNVSGVLSKLAAYGKIDRAKHPSGKCALWKPKAGKGVSHHGKNCDGD